MANAAAEAGSTLVVVAVAVAARSKEEAGVDKLVMGEEAEGLEEEHKPVVMVSGTEVLCNMQLGRSPCKLCCKPTGMLLGVPKQLGWEKETMEDNL